MNDESTLDEQGYVAQGGAALVLVTAPDAETAGRLARSLVDARLAACVTSLPVGSVYRWEGKIEEGAEVLLLIKTTAARLAELTAAVKGQHPYKVPEVISVDVTGGLGAYLAWLARETTP
jgi:periplasmic divalent cation tolerance protein